MNSLSDIYFLDSNIMLFTQFVQQPQENLSNHQQSNQVPMPEQKLSNLESLVALNDDVYEIVPVDPLASCQTYQNQQDISYSYMTDGAQVNEGLAVLEILYNHPVDVPEYIDINDLVAPDPLHEDPLAVDVDGSPDCDDEDNDDVIFVAEYKSEDNQNDYHAIPSDSNAGTNAPRRNPIRKARKNARVLTKDLLYDEDYTILESSSDEDAINETLKKSARSNSSLTVKDYKKWPVNGLHERPEYNDTTKQLEKFDYTIRQIRNSVVLKKTPPKITKKPIKKRKYVSKRKTLAKTEVQEKVPVAELEDLVDSTLMDVRRYILNLETSNTIMKKVRDKENIDASKKPEVGECVSESTADEKQQEKRNFSKCDKISDNILEGLALLKTQAVLYQVINNANEKGLMKYFNAIK